MSCLPDIVKLLEEKLEDLQRDTKFCINNYDYHHKNNEYDILQQLQDILNDSFQDGQEYLNNIQKIRGLIDRAQQKCLEVDVMLKDLGVDPEIGDIATASSTAGNCPTSSHSFTEDDLKHCYDLEGNKENENY